jgi:ATP-dependent helicase/DNAse subunit B
MDIVMDQDKDKFKAIWLSHSSISDFLNCPRLYYLRNIYKDPKNNHKINIISPPLSLGQAVHEVVESLSTLPVEKRMVTPLSKRFELVWAKVAGEKGGFKDKTQEDEYKQRGLKMLKTVEENPGPLTKKAIKIKSEGGLPYYWFSSDENIILCGKIDWLEYLPESDGVHIIDFKTGKYEEDETSLQLPIYLLLASNTQNRKIEKASYWYLDRDNKPRSKKLPDPVDAYDSVYEVAKRIKLARQIEHFVCPKDGCRHCVPFEMILNGNAKKVGVSEFGQDLYVLLD